MTSPARRAWPDPLTIDPETVPSAVLRRLIAEVQREAAEAGGAGAPHATPPAPAAYDRVHNRHNRGPTHLPHPYDRVHNRHNRGR